MATPSFASLSELRKRLAIRLGFGAQANTITNQIPIFDDFLQSAQTYLCRSVKWRHLQCLHIDDLGVGQRVLDLPDGCGIDGVRRVLVLDGVEWREIKAGLPMDAGETGCPIRYEFSANADGVGQLHFYPVPNDIVPVGIEYYAVPSRFTANDDRASIPDDLIFLHALANAKAHYRQPDAQAASGQLENALIRARESNFGVDDSRFFSDSWARLWVNNGYDYVR